jgi:Enolase C-terminal domain-like
VLPLTIDVTGGEQDWDFTVWRRMIETRAVDIVQPDVMYMGGLTRTLWVVSMAAEAGLPCTPYSANLSLVTVCTMYLLGDPGRRCHPATTTPQPLRQTLNSRNHSFSLPPALGTIRTSAVPCLIRLEETLPRMLLASARRACVDTTTRSQSLSWTADSIA